MERPIIDWSPEPQRPEVPPHPTGMPPHSPRAADIRKTPHGLHLALTIVLVIVTFGTLGWLWLVVWLIHAIGNGAGNRREWRRYDRELHEWQEIVVQWQFHCRNILGYEMQLPPGW